MIKRYFRQKKKLNFKSYRKRYIHKASDFSSGLWALLPYLNYRDKPDCAHKYLPHAKERLILRRNLIKQKHLFRVTKENVYRYKYGKSFIILYKLASAGKSDVDIYSPSMVAKFRKLPSEYSMTFEYDSAEWRTIIAKSSNGAEINDWLVEMNIKYTERLISFSKNDTLKIVYEFQNATDLVMFRLKLSEFY